MTWRIAVVHRTGYRYESEVESSYNEARVTPLTTLGQTTLDSSVEVSPTASILRYWDYWGTMVHAFDVHVPHTELEVVASAVVETGQRGADGPAPAEVQWSQLASLAAVDRHGELLAPTVYVPRSPEIAAAAAEIAGGCRGPAEACDAAVGWVRDHVRYEKGSTHVASSATDALASGAGVCQDFSHLTLALLRAMDVPSRYVSGYLHPNDGAEVGDRVAGESHAWVEAWLGEWVPFDPTAGSYSASRHVIVGRGRDYGDVAPLKGIYHGGACESLGVTVELTRVA